MVDGRKYENFFFEKVLEQHISFNFLDSKVSDLAAICQKQSSLTSTNLKSKGSNFIQSNLNDMLYF